MGRLLRAEWYRFWRSSHLYMYFITFLAFGFVFHEQIVLILPIMTSASVGMLYYYKTSYYQIIAGSRISHVLLSKVLVDGVFIGVVTAAICLLYYVCYGVRDSAGIQGEHMEMRQLTLRIVLLFALAVKASVSGVLITESVKTPAGVLLSYVRFLPLEGLIGVAVSNTVSDYKWAQRYIDCTLYGQINMLYEETVTAYMVVIIAVGVLLEFVFWYGVAYLTMKRKWFM